MEPYLTETHFHTSETSVCGKIPAAEGIALCRERGYAAVIVTDHYVQAFFAEREALSWQEKMDCWLNGYKAAKEAGDRLGVRVYLGMEWRYMAGPEDFLVYGITEEFLRETPELYRILPEEFAALCRKQGFFFAETHPFRFNMRRLEPSYLQGVEVFNGNMRHDSHNDQAQAFCRENGLVPLSGSDFHERDDIARGGIYLTELPRNEAALAELIAENRHSLRKS